MADLTATGGSGYSTGSIDTATVLVNNVSPTDAKHVNGAAAAAVQIEGILGSGTTLKGSTADLATRLAVGLTTAGLLKLDTAASISGPLDVVSGGTGVATLTDGGVLVGNGTGDIVAISPPSALKVFTQTGSGDPSWLSGIITQGPSACGSGSTRSHEGSVTISADQNLSGVHFYTDFTLNASKTLTIEAGYGGLMIVATGTITINGTITGAGKGAAANTEGANATSSIFNDGHPGTDQHGGGGEAGPSISGGRGGPIVSNGALIAMGPNAATGATQRTASQIVGMYYPRLGGGASGGSGGRGSGGEAGGTGGAGGASIILIAPTVVLGSGAILNTEGNSGGTGGGGSAGAGGGGGGGNVTIITGSYTDGGATFTLTGGAAGSAGAGAGATGVKQILVYA